MTIQNKRIFASILFVLISFVCVAQGSEPPPPGPPPPPGTPIDGGLLAGACFALFYGVKKLLKKS
ncbi:PID-CTERM protein-sorting domain-containing protein [Hwangdonia sp.]|uniref:PID-CTERM protein-sorting domain-containing protein n=1 Tax=Hwangdonia sp. TaxID=1883432 RepID=UPI003AB528F5